MEDALARNIVDDLGVTYESLNPCCNGRCTRTRSSILKKAHILKKVLILVVMEDALAPAYSVLCHTANKDVLILVVMEDALALLTF